MPNLKPRPFLVAGIVLLVCAGLGAWGVKWSSTDSFCLSCHEMGVYKAELKLSPHAVDIKGREISCSQCHIPAGGVLRMLGAKAWMGMVDLWVHHVDGGQNLDRLAMQKVARRFTDDANCLACHQNLERDARDEGPISIEGKLAHANYLGTNGQSRSGCVGCHRNLAHLPVFDMRIPTNQKFAAKLKESRQ